MQHVPLSCLPLVMEPPSIIMAEQMSRSTSRVTWQPVDDVLHYQVVVQNLDKPDDAPYVRNVSGTVVDVDGILPCSTYLISVSSFNKFLMLGEPTNYTYSTNSESAEPNQYQ